MITAVNSQAARARNIQWRKQGDVRKYVVEMVRK